MNLQKLQIIQLFHKKSLVNNSKQDFDMIAILNHLLNDIFKKLVRKRDLKRKEKGITLFT